MAAPAELPQGWSAGGLAAPGRCSHLSSCQQVTGHAHVDTVDMWPRALFLPERRFCELSQHIDLCTAGCSRRASCGLSWGSVAMQHACTGLHLAAMHTLAMNVATQSLSCPACA